MYLSRLNIKNHPILKNIDINLINPNTNEPYSIIAFVGENGCGKTTILNEVFNYNNSEYIQDKQKPDNILQRPFNALYLRQGSLHKNAMKEVGKLIDGKDRYPSNSTVVDGGENQFGLKSNNAVNRLDKGLSILENLGDDVITNIYKDKQIGEVYCSTDVSKVIDGKEHGYDIKNYSSGQQEILLKLKDLKNMSVGTDCVLLDEPETSLHPRWQKEIVDLIKSLLTDEKGEVPQIFLATHSEKVLGSLMRNPDALIIRIYKEGNGISYETISQMDMVLRRPSFAELDYIIFKIKTAEYCSELLSLLEDIYDISGDYGMDRKILASEFYYEKKHYKEWYNEKKKEVTAHNIAIYVRNYFHHPKNKEEPTEEEINEAIELLRKILGKYKQEHPDKW